MAESDAADSPELVPSEEAATVRRGRLGDYHERFVPELHRETLLASEHFARYVWAAPLAEGRDLLDAGCGAGYGLELLIGSGAAGATGLDVDSGAIAAARERCGPAAELIEADLLILPFEDRRFDLITCFEVIEHVADPDRALDELQRVLRPDGILAISSPQRGAFPEGNPFHVREYTADELASALDARFAHVDLYGQHPHYGTLIAPATAHIVSDPQITLEAELRKCAGTSPEQQPYTLAVASDAEPPALATTAVLGGGVDVAAMVAAYGYWEDRARRAEAERDLEEMDHERTRAIREITLELLARYAPPDLGALSPGDGAISGRGAGPLRRLRRRLRRR